MPRLGTGSELFKYLTSVTKYVVTTSGGDTTTAEAIVVDAEDVNVTAITNFTAADVCMIDGSGGTELVTIGTPATTPMPVTRPFAIAQDSGARFVEMTAASLNHIAEGGVQFGGSLTLTEIKAATSRTAIAFIADAAVLTWTIPVLGFNLLNLQAAFGATEGEQGAGTVADPHQVVIGPDTVGTQGIHCYRCLGVRHDGKIVEVDFLDCTVEVNTNITIGAPNPDGMTITGKAGTITGRIWTPA